MIIFKLTYTGAVPKVAKRKFNQLTKAAWQNAGEFWHEKFMPKHFTHRGATEYGYTKRKGEGLPRGAKAYNKSYTAKKFREKGHTFPLVFSGKSQALARVRNVRATRNGVKILINAPALNLRHPKSEINMRAEMTTVSPRETLEIAARFQRVLTNFLNRVSVRSTKRIGRKIA